MAEGPQRQQQDHHQASGLSVDDLARRAGVATEQVRAWRDAGLVGETDGGYFSLRDVERVRLIQLFVRRGVDQAAIGAWVRSGEMDRHVDLLVSPGGATYTL